MNLRQCALSNLSRDVLASVAASGTAGAVAYTLADILRQASSAQRVTLILCDSDEHASPAVVMSGQTRPDARRQAVRGIIDCVREAHASVLASVHGSEPEKRTQSSNMSGSTLGSQSGSVWWPSGDGIAAELSTEESAHGRLAADNNASLTTYVTCFDGVGYAAWVLEREPHLPFAMAETARYEAAASDSLALIHRLHRERLSVLRRLKTVWRELRAALARPSALRSAVAVWQRRVPRRATLALAACVVTTAGLTIPVPQVVTARVTIEAADRQVVSVAEAGHLQSAHVKPGDSVTEGDVLATLDERDAILVLASWKSEAHRNQEQRSRALATRDREALGTLRADSARITAEVERAERQLAFRRIQAPFSGVVLKGDPSSKLGAAVEVGEVLFEIGTLDHVRMMIDVDERDVRFIKPGQRARVRLAGLPSRRWDVKLDELLPVAVAEKPGSNVFRVPAQVAGERSGLRPGMQGVSRISVGKQPLLIAWTRNLRETAVLWAWRLGLLA
jgi:RND family efflux transporter MFP subunit